jgi:hypothetical protein
MATGKSAVLTAVRTSDPKKLMFVLRLICHRLRDSVCPHGHQQIPSDDDRHDLEAHHEEDRQEDDRREALVPADLADLR